MIFTEISSRKNEKIIWASKLCDKKKRDAEGVFVTDGIKLLEEAILSDEPVVIDCRVKQIENVYPMVAPGKGLHEMIGGERL